MSYSKEPTIRIGIVFPEDGMASIHCSIPDHPYSVSGGPDRQDPIRAHTADVVATGDRVQLTSGTTTIPSAEAITLAPAEPIPLKRGAGLQLRDVVTGRGFHWQKRMHPTLCGKVEFRAVAGRLLVINDLPMEDYLIGVIASEMSGDCPLEFLKSQCIVARSWVVARTEPKHAGLPIDRCNDDCCQRYHGTSDFTPTVLQAVRDTRGQVLVDAGNRIIDANYSKSCGGIMEPPENVWGVKKAGLRAAVDAPAESPAQRFLPITAANLQEYLTGSWLAGTDCFCSPTVVPERDLPRYLGKVDEGGGHFRWRIEHTREELEATLQRKFFSRQDAAKVPPLGTLLALRPLGRGVSGRIIDLEIAYRDPAGAEQRVTIHTEYRIREALSDKFLFSSAFDVQTERDAAGVPTRVTLLGAGWGHGAGLCQIGALGMAVKGYTCEQIMHHYFEEIRISAQY